MSCMEISNYQITKFLQFFLLYSLVVVCLSSPIQLCHNEEGIALLQFKQLFSFNCFVCSCNSNQLALKTDNWKEGTDCCAWNGVTCDNTTGHVIGLDLNCNCLYGTIHPNSSLFNLVHLQKLDLSWNNFNHSQILPSFGRFTHLTHLNLSYSKLSGQIQSSEVWQGNNFPNSIFHLQKLQELRLGNNRELTVTLPSFINGTLQHLRLLDLKSCNLSSSIPRWFGNLANSLRYLYLGGNNLNGGQFPSSISQLKNLVDLDLSYCNFSGTIPRSLGNLTKLRYLDLGGNNLNGGQFLSSISQLMNLESLSLRCRNFSVTFPRSLGNLTKLRYLSLEGSNLNRGQFPSSISQLKNLKVLDLRDCNFSGTIPRSLGNLTQLTYLCLASNHFSGKIVSSSFSYLENLSYLDLAHNNFEGPIPQLFFNFSQLVYLDFSYNQLTGPIPSSIIGLPFLESLNFGSNSINGTIPSSLFHLVNLSSLDLSSNNLSDTVELDMFAKLENLAELDLSNSGISLTTANSVRSSFPNMMLLQLSSCNISTIPEFLKTRMERLLMVDLSNNKINEELSPSICNLRYLEHLDLSNNQFYGLIPTCLGKFSDLIVLNLQRNSFHGAIPQTLGFANWLKSLDISHNGLQGVLPRSLANCTNLEILNVGHNLIVDIFPFWLENLPRLKVLILRDNKLHGPIGKPRNKSAFTNLHVIDVSHNDFTGTLPSKYFESWHTMMTVVEDISQPKYLTSLYGSYYSMTIMNKGLEMSYGHILTIFKAVDFSHNKFRGKIPTSIGRLKGLCVLNFSRNGLIGPIPLSLVNLTELESLDLSQNKLFGEIPQQLTSLTFLEVFDVSQNNLTGIIPRGQQFDTFSNTSYEGNLGLCGLPLSKKCGNVKRVESPTLPSPFRHNFKFKIDSSGWEVELMGYGCGILLGLVIGSCIIQRKEEWLVRIFGPKMRQHGNKSKKVC